MQTELIHRTASAYAYPLLIKHLLRTPMVRSPKQEIVHRELKRHDYLTFAERVGKLAGSLESLGVQAGKTVGVMDWDSHRYLECFYGVPMMGAILQRHKNIDVNWQGACAALENESSQNPLFEQHPLRYIPSTAETIH